MVAEPARDQVPEWDGQVNTLERFEEDVLIFTHAVPKERKATIGPKLLQQFPKHSPQSEIGLELLKSGVLQLEDGATQLLKLIRLRLGKDLQQDVSEHYKRFLHRSARMYQQSMQHYLAEESNFHERALQAAKSVSTSGKDEPETKEINAVVLRGFLLLESAALTGSEQVFVFGVAGKSYAYNHIATALRETWGNDDRLRSHDLVTATTRRPSCRWCTGQENKTIGKRRTTTSKTHWNHGHQNGITPMDTTTNLISKKQAGPRTSARLTTTILTAVPSPIAILHRWTKLSKHKKETRANLRLYKKQ